MNQLQLKSKTFDNYLLIALLREIAILAVCKHQNIAKIQKVYFNP